MEGRLTQTEKRRLTLESAIKLRFTFDGLKKVQTGGRFVAAMGVTLKMSAFAGHVA
jgi:hypothetical protein